jgi:hypothetical protein
LSGFCEEEELGGGGRIKEGGGGKGGGEGEGRGEEKAMELHYLLSKTLLSYATPGQFLHVSVSPFRHADNVTAHQEWDSEYK